MKYFLILLLLYSGSLLALNAQIYDENKQIEGLGLEVQIDYVAANSCLEIEIGVKSTHSFYQGEEGETEDAEVSIEKEFSGISYQKYMGEIDNGYTLFNSASAIGVVTKKAGNRNRARLCIHESDIENSFLLINYYLEKTCPELIYIPISYFHRKYVEKS